MLSSRYIVSVWTWAGNPSSSIVRTGACPHEFLDCSLWEAGPGPWGWGPGFLYCLLFCVHVLYLEGHVPVQGGLLVNLFASIFYFLPSGRPSIHPFSQQIFSVSHVLGMGLGAEAKNHE